MENDRSGVEAKVAEIVRRLERLERAWEKREVIHSGPDKVHIDTRFIRYRADGSVLASFDSLYVVTKQDGRWGVVARSSFAP